MVTLRIIYHEIMDYDWTAVEILIIQDGQCVTCFRNYDREELTKELYSNQTDEFQLPDLSTALQMVKSNAHYRACNLESFDA